MMAGDNSRHINICSELLLESQHVWQELPLTFGNNYPLTPESLLCFDAPMVVLEKVRQRSAKLAGSVACAFVVAYFAYGTVQGDRGLLSYFSLTQELERAQSAYEELRESRRGLEHRVTLLRPSSLDLDLLEERARVVLDLVREDDFIVLMPETAGTTTR